MMRLLGDHLRSPTGLRQRQPLSVFHAVSCGAIGVPTHLTVPHDEHLMVQRDVGVLELQQGHQLYREGTEYLSQYCSATYFKLCYIFQPRDGPPAWRGGRRGAGGA